MGVRETWLMVDTANWVADLLRRAEKLDPNVNTLGRLLQRKRLLVPLGVAVKEIRTRMARLERLRS